MARSYDSYWPPYVPVAERRRRAAQKVAQMKKAGQEVSPVEISGRTIATTFWGGAWCDNLEAYSDYANRLPRGRTYVRNGSVVDLQIEAGRVRSLVSGSDLYSVDIAVEALSGKKWTEIKRKCAGQIDSLVELLQGSISKSVMEIVTRKGEGLFPSPSQISLRCSCPDWATMCKHVAATLYGVGARLDHAPELLFTLAGVDPTELVETALDQSTVAGTTRSSRVLEADALSSVFGVDIDLGGASSPDGTSPIRHADGTPRARTKRKRPAARPTAEKRQTRTVRGATAGSKKSGTTKKAATKKVATKKAATKKAKAKPIAKRVSAKKASVRTSAAKASAGRKSTRAGSRKTATSDKATAGVSGASASKKKPSRRTSAATTATRTAKQ